MLVDDLKVLLATQVSLYIKSANFHWNIEGTNFPQYHDFLGDYYSEVYDQVDRIAEYIRTLDSYTPASLSMFTELTLIQDQNMVKLPVGMLTELYADNSLMIDYLNKVFASATAEGKQGICNFIADRLDSHEKSGWKLRSILKSLIKI